MGREATDHLSQTQGGNTNFTKLQSLLQNLPSRDSHDLTSDMQSLQHTSDSMRVGNNNAGVMNMSQAGDFDPEEIAKKIYPILQFRDRIVKAINATIEKVLSVSLLVELDSWT